MKPENAIEVHNVSKAFKVYLDKGRTMKERVIFKNRRKYEVRQVLDDISFEMKKGEAVGLIGQNGCGKSTTLKLLTRIMYPDSGTIEMRGRVSSLIELGAGFHPDMSGRENIYINASIFGLSKKEIYERLEDIISFSELEEYIENPVRTYSSGMYMRLAFAVAINVDADILLIDEILAVGDANYQTKCFERLREIKSQGTTVVIVSHSLGQIEQICNRTIWINEGKIELDGSPHDVHMCYLDYMNNKKRDKKRKKVEEKSEEKEDIDDENRRSEKDKYNKNYLETGLRFGTGEVEFIEIHLLDEEDHDVDILYFGEEYRIVAKFRVNEPVEKGVFYFSVYRSDGLCCYGTDTNVDCVKEFDICCNGTLTIKFDGMSLMPAKYYVDLAIGSVIAPPVDYMKKALSFEVVSKITDNGIMRIPHLWNIHFDRSGK